MEAQFYEEIWQAFIHGDHITAGAIWGGEGLALIVPVEHPDVVGRIQKIQSRLSAELPFQPHLPETLHITFRLLGNPAPDCLSDLTGFLRACLLSLPPFEVHIKAVNSFFRAPFLEVHDQGRLSAAMQLLAPGLKERAFPEIDYGPRGQVWHITLGAYTQENDGVAARQLLKQLRPLNTGKILVDEFRLVRTSAGKPYRLTTVEAFTLAGKS